MWWWRKHHRRLLRFSDDRPELCYRIDEPGWVNDIFSDPVFKALDKGALVELFDPSPKIMRSIRDTSPRLVSRHRLPG